MDVERDPGQLKRVVSDISPPSNQAAEATANQLRRRSRSGRFRQSIAATAVVLTLLALGGGIYYSLQPSSYFPSAIHDKASAIALYYPVHPPAGIAVDRSSFQTPQSNVVTYTVLGKNNTKFYVSIEPTPVNFDFTAFKKKFPQTADLSLATGSGFVGDLGAQLVASIQTQQNTWILINTRGTTAQTELTELAQSMAQTK